MDDQTEKDYPETIEFWLCIAGTYCAMGVLCLTAVHLA